MKVTAIDIAAWGIVALLAMVLAIRVCLVVREDRRRRKDREEEELDK